MNWGYEYDERGVRKRRTYRRRGGGGGDLGDLGGLLRDLMPTLELADVVLLHHAHRVLRVADVLEVIGGVPPCKSVSDQASHAARHSRAMHERGGSNGEIVS